MTQVLFIRHGPTEWNESGLIQGQTDVPLSEAGRAQVARWRLPTEALGQDWVTSPLARAVETARLLGVAECARDARLSEANWGDWEGKSLKALRAELGEELARNEALGLDLTPPRGESPRQVRDRVAAWLAEAAPRRRPIVAVTHAGVLRAAYSLATGWNMKSDAPIKKGHAHAHLYELSAEGTLAIRTLNMELEPADGG